jgi:hypothetical protein
MNRFFNLLDKNKNFKNYFKSFIIYILKNFTNFFKIIIDNKIDNFYLPNLFIRNVIMINPNKVKYFNSIPMKFYKSTKFIIDFDWDKENKIITEHEKDHQVYGSCKEIFIDGTPIEKSKMYFYLQKNINHPIKSKGCKNNNDIINFLNSKVELFKNIRKDGLLKNIDNNIEFMIDRNHNLVKINSGNHRFAISRILKLKKIPVEIKVIHLNCFSNNSKMKIKIKKINKIIKNIENNYA